MYAIRSYYDAADNFLIGVHAVALDDCDAVRLGARGEERADDLLGHEEGVEVGAWARGGSGQPGRVDVVRSFLEGGSYNFV